MTDAPRTADSCRLALPSEAERLAAIQRRSWQQLLPIPVAEQILGEVDLAAMTASWQAAIQRPPLAKFRVLVAVADKRVVGFAAVGPSDDPDADPGSDALVGEFIVDPVTQRQGHGSRLLNAVADTLRSALVEVAATTGAVKVPNGTTKKVNRIVTEALASV